METNKVLELYDREYAEVYDDRFIHTEGYRHVTGFEVELLEQFLSVTGRWLDVACGTGYFLSRFPEAERAGIDISPGMLSVAGERNPGALFLEERDFRVPKEEFEGRWELVSSMWGAYCYVESMTELDRFIRNISDWTADDGICFLPLIDLEDVLYWRETLQYCNPDIQIFGGPSYVNGVIWSYVDNLHDKRHENLIAAHIEYLRERFGEHFSRIDTIYYPPYPAPVPGQRKGLVAAGKNGPVPERIASVLDDIQAVSEKNRAAVLSMAELEKMLDPGNETEAPPDGSSETPGEPPAGWLRRAWRRLPGPVRRTVRRAVGEDV